jgi:hypothetical protein
MSSAIATASSKKILATSKMFVSTSAATRI